MTLIKLLLYIWAVMLLLLSLYCVFGFLRWLNWTHLFVLYYLSFRWISLARLLIVVIIAVGLDVHWYLRGLNILLNVILFIFFVLVLEFLLSIYCIKASKIWLTLKITFGSCLIYLETTATWCFQSWLQLTVYLFHLQFLQVWTLLFQIRWWFLTSVSHINFLMVGVYFDLLTILSGLNSLQFLFLRLGIWALAPLVTSYIFLCISYRAITLFFSWVLIISSIIYIGIGIILLANGYLFFLNCTLWTTSLSFFQGHFRLSRCRRLTCTLAIQWTNFD